MGHGHSLSKTESHVIGQGQRSMQNVPATRVSTAASYEYRLMAEVVGFHRDVIRWRAMKHSRFSISSSILVTTVGTKLMPEF